MRLVSAAGGVLLAAHHVAGFGIRLTTNEACTFNDPLQRRAVLQHRRTATAATRSSWSCSGSRERPPCPRKSRRRRWRATLAAGTPGSSRGAVVMMCSAPVTAVTKDHEASTGGGLRLAVVGENADELGLRLAERYGLEATSMDELMKGRKGRKTDNVKARAASEWLAGRGATAVGETDSRESRGRKRELLLDTRAPRLYSTRGICCTTEQRPFISLALFSYRYAAEMSVASLPLLFLLSLFLFLSLFACLSPSRPLPPSLMCDRRKSLHAQSLFPFVR